MTHSLLKPAAHGWYISISCLSRATKPKSEKTLAIQDEIYVFSLGSLCMRCSISSTGLGSSRRNSWCSLVQRVSKSHIIRSILILGLLLTTIMVDPSTWGRRAVLGRIGRDTIKPVRKSAIGFLAVWSSICRKVKSALTYSGGKVLWGVIWSEFFSWRRASPVNWSLIMSHIISLP